MTQIVEDAEKSGMRILWGAIFRSVTGKYAVYAFQLLSLVSLSRLIEPETFGFFAILHVFVVFFSLFSEMGIAPALINQKNITLEMRDGIFSATAILGIFLAAAFIAASPLISHLYSYEYTVIAVPVALAIFFDTVSIVSIASLQKDKKFLTIARCQSISELLSLIAAVITLSLFSPIWGLAVKPFVASLAKFLFVRAASAESVIGIPRFGRQVDRVKDIFAFSSYQMAFNVVNYFSRNLDNLLIGKYFGATGLGVYDKAYQLMRYPLTLLTFAMNPAIQPVMSEIRDDPAEFERLHNKFILILSILGLFVGILMYFGAGIIVALLLGDQWFGVVPILQVFSVMIPIQVVMSTSGGFFQAFNRVDLLFKCGLFSCFTNVTAIFVGIYEGSISSICWALVSSFTINFLQCYFIMGTRLFNNGLGRLSLALSPFLFGYLLFIVLILSVGN